MTAQLLPGDRYGQDEPGRTACHWDRAQPIPRNRGCSMAALYTITFQAPAFYERQGYRVLGRVECRPPGYTRMCMTKAL
jgi:hypothetical protein